MIILIYLQKLCTSLISNIRIINYIKIFIQGICMLLSKGSSNAVRTVQRFMVTSGRHYQLPFTEYNKNNYRLPSIIF